MHKEKYEWVNTVLKWIKSINEVKEKLLIGSVLLALSVEIRRMWKG